MRIIGQVLVRAIRVCHLRQSQVLVIVEVRHQFAPVDDVALVAREVMHRGRAAEYRAHAATRPSRACGLRGLCPPTGVGSLCIRGRAERRGRHTGRHGGFVWRHNELLCNDPRKGRMVIRVVCLSMTAIGTGGDFRRLKALDANVHTIASNGLAPDSIFGLRSHRISHAGHHPRGWIIGEGLGV